MPKPENRDKPTALPHRTPSPRRTQIGRGLARGRPGPELTPIQAFRRGRKGVASNKEERIMVAEFRRIISPQPPEGWVDVHGDVRQLTPVDRNVPKVFARLFRGKGMQLLFTIDEGRNIRISLSGANVVPSPEMIETAKADFFPGLEVGHTSPRAGLLFLLPPASAFV